MATLYYQATNASSVQCCSGQTDRQYLVTEPGVNIVAVGYNKLDII